MILFEKQLNNDLIEQNIKKYLIISLNAKYLKNKIYLSIRVSSLNLALV